MNIFEAKRIDVSNSYARYMIINTRTSYYNNNHNQKIPALSEVSETMVHSALLIPPI